MACPSHVTSSQCAVVRAIDVVAVTLGTLKESDKALSSCFNHY